MATQNKYRLDRKLTAMMVEDFVHNPILAAKVLLGLRIPPHEQIRMMWMWCTAFTIDDSGFSTGKSHNIAVIAALRSILFPQRVSGILSLTFSQGQLIFQNIDRWYYSSAIFRSLVQHANGKPRLIHAQTAFQAFFRGGSEIRVLPPAFMKDSERLRSERWHDGYFDEWTTYGKFEAFNKTILGRVTRDNEYVDDPIRQNHVHLSSTPSFTYEPAYGIVRRWQNQIAQGNTDYSRISFNYRHVPDTKKWRWLINRRAIFNMQISLPPGTVAAEIDGLWQDDSGAFYSSAAITLCRYHIAPVMLERGVGSDIYIAAFDVARGGNEAGSSGDDFALTVMRLPPNSNRPHQCLTIRKFKITAAAMAGVIHKYHRKFGFALILYDPQGGGLFVRDELKKPEQLIENELTKVDPLIELFDNSGTIGHGILVPIRRTDFYISRMWGKMASDSVLINRIHNEMKGAIANQNVILTAEYDGWPGEASQWDIDSKREWLNRNQGMNELERAKAEMDLAVHQLQMVDIKRDKAGVPILDSYGMFQFKSKGKKDSAYSLVYAHLGTVIWRNLHDSGLIIDNRRRRGQSRIVLSQSPLVN